MYHEVLVADVAWSRTDASGAVNDEHSLTLGVLDGIDRLQA